MHISEGVLPWQSLAVGAALAAAGTAIGLKRMDYDKLPRVAAFSSAFFVASLIRVPFGVSSVHLILNGLAGVILGWAAFPALLVALFLQAVFFQFGGVIALGANTTIMASPAVLCGLAFRRMISRGAPAVAATGGFLAGGLSIVLSCALWAIFMNTAGKQFGPAIVIELSTHIPVIGIEAFLTMSTVMFLRKVRPEILSLEARKTYG